MVLKKKEVNGFDELTATLENLEGRIIIYFIGTREDGKSWCPDCVKAEPAVEKAIAECSGPCDKEIVFVECNVGFKDYWKDQTNPFRIDERFKLTEIPTLIEFGDKVKKLSGDQCANEALVKELFLED